MGFWLPEAKPKVRKKANCESVGSSSERMRTCEGAGALTKEQGGTFCSLTACYCVKLVSLSEIMPIRPYEGSGAAIGLGNRVSGQSGFVDDKGKFHPRTCFTKGTLVHTINGLKAIEEIQVGDIVVTKEENSEKLVYKKVTELFRNEVEYLFKIKLSSGEQIVTTWNHPFRKMNNDRNRNYSTAVVSLIGFMEKDSTSKEEWIEAKDLRKGDNLVNSNGDKVTIASIESLGVQKTTVYNFEVEDTHSYFVGKEGIWVHNYEKKYDEAVENALKLLQKEIKKSRRNPSALDEEKITNLQRKLSDAENLRDLEIQKEKNKSIFDLKGRENGIEILKKNQEAYFKGKDRWESGEIDNERYNNVLITSYNNIEQKVFRRYEKGEYTLVASESLTKKRFKKELKIKGTNNTYCNAAASVISKEMGGPNFMHPNSFDITANTISDYLSKGKFNTKTEKFEEVRNVEYMSEYAKKGGLVVGVYKNPKGHGHILTLTGGFEGKEEKQNLKIYQAGIDFGEMKLVEGIPSYKKMKFYMRMKK
jgi:hypothetical protein